MHGTDFAGCPHSGYSAALGAVSVQGCKGSFAAVPVNGGNAPIPAGRRVAVEPLESTDAPGPKSLKKKSIVRLLPAASYSEAAAMVGTGGAMRSNSIPKGMLAIYERIVGLTD